MSRKDLPTALPALSHVGKHPAPHPGPSALPLPLPVGSRTPAPSPARSTLIGFLLCAAALLLEGLALAAAISDLLLVRGALLSLVLHSLGCAIAAHGLHRLMPPSQQTPRLAGLLFLFAITFFMPLFGALGMLGGLLAELYFPSPLPPPPPWLCVPMPELPHQASTITARLEYGDGALSAMLRYCPDPERRLSAVLAVRHLRDANDAEVVRLALTDPTDDVRLLAYSLLDHREQQFNVRLKGLLGQLASTATDDPRHGKIEKRLAQTQFEMIQLGLCQGEVLDYLLLEARGHIDQALRAEAEDRESQFLLGCIALRQRALSTAESAFLRAQVLGMSLEKVLPCLAEIAFLQRRFEMVTHYLRAIDPVCLRAEPRLGGIAAHWLPEEPPCLPKP